jgi:hypothetical protein
MNAFIPFGFRPWTKRVQFGVLALLAVLPAWTSAQGQSPELAMETRVLFGPESAKQWSAAESSLEASAPPVGAGHPVLHWHIAVDHFAGEAKYPIGWPRISRALRDAALRDWSGWDYLQFRVYTDTSRDALPRDPVGLALHTPDKDSAYHRPLTELKKGAWAQIRIPLSAVPRHQDVRLMQFHISESNYRHQDRLDFYFDGLALLRHAHPTLLDFAAEDAVMFADTKQVPVRFHLVGVKPGASVEVSCELKVGRELVTRAKVKATRGANRVAFDLGGRNLKGGAYQIEARAADGTTTATATVRFVESPWK